MSHIESFLSPILPTLTIYFIVSNYLLIFDSNFTVNEMNCYFSNTHNVCKITKYKGLLIKQH
jgi:hypothetical protein